MDFGLTEQQRSMVATVRELVDNEFKPNAAKYMDGTFPWENMRRLAELAAELPAVEVIVGLPRTLADRTGPSAQDAVALAEELARRIAPTPVRLADERLTTVSAQRSLRAAGVRAKEQRAVIDQAAAVAILQGWLDERRAMLPGEVNGV